MDSYGEPIPLDTDPSGPLGKALDELDRFDPVAAAEIRAAVEAGAYGVLVIAGGQGAVGAELGGGGICIVVEKRTTHEIATTLVHEWEHARRRAGYDDNVPNSPAEEIDPCSHTVAVARELQVLSDILTYYYLETGTYVVDCEEIKRAQSNCYTYTAECEAAGGTPAASCDTPFLDPARCP
ncbi:MAG: hypothetical protein Q8K82_11225 [Gemmatimonadaceae bacterium]|nr:hypothetical protein [Gemmatimonadaceae bacterium]